jgi:hypothetical protein
MRSGVVAAAAVLLALAYAPAASAQQQGHENAILDLWTQGKPAFGVYVPAAGGGRGGGAPAGPRYTVEMGRELAANPLYDYVFLNLEGGGSYDPQAITAIHEGLRSSAAVSRKTLMVRIPSVESAGEEVTRARIREAFDLGADAVTVPHVRGVEEARTVIGWFNEAVPDIWSPENPSGERIGMLMIEDPVTLTQAAEIADLPGFSVLACGIGSIGGAFRAGGIVPALVSLGLLTEEAAGNLGEIASARVLAESKRTGHPNMLTANAQNVEQRIADGYLSLLFQGGGADDAIRVGRAAAGR